MNKLDALKTLSHAYYYLFLTDAGNDALEVLSDKFHHVRRSTTLLDLAPKKNTEGTNPNGPRYF